TYTSISSEARSWSILTEDPYEEAARQALEQASPPLSLAYVPDPMKLEDHVQEEEKSSEDDDDEEEEHLAPADSTAIASPAVDLVPSAEETEPFETDESAATPPPPPAYRTTSRMSVRTQTPILFPSEAEVARLLALPTPPPSPLTQLSSPLPHIPSPPLPLPSPPTHTSPTYVEAPLGYRAIGIQLRAASSLPLHVPSTSRRVNIPEADLPPRKRLCLTAPTPRFEVGESSAAAAAKQPGSTVARRVDYSFVDTVDARTRAFERRTMDALEVVNLRVSYLADVRRRESEEFYTRHQDAQRDCTALRDKVDTLRRCNNRQFLEL
ncbi:hypothetical protein Tco_0775363, partial [Tanacetum coccineum]